MFWKILNIFLMILDDFNVLILKINLKKIKNILF
jgi:hypothetical protein